MLPVLTGLTSPARSVTIAPTMTVLCLRRGSRRFAPPRTYASGRNSR